MDIKSGCTDIAVTKEIYSTRNTKEHRCSAGEDAREYDRCIVSWMRKMYRDNSTCTEGTSTE